MNHCMGASVNSNMSACGFPNGVIHFTEGLGSLHLSGALKWREHFPDAHPIVTDQWERTTVGHWPATKDILNRPCTCHVSSSGISVYVAKGSSQSLVACIQFEEKAKLVETPDVTYKPIVTYYRTEKRLFPWVEFRFSGACSVQVYNGPWHRCTSSGTEGLAYRACFK